MTLNLEFDSENTQVITFINTEADEVLNYELELDAELLSTIPGVGKNGAAYILAEIGNDDAVIGVLRNREMEVRIIGRLLWRIFEYAVKQGIYMEGVIKVLLKSYEK